MILMNNKRIIWIYTIFLDVFLLSFVNNSTFINYSFMLHDSIQDFTLLYQEALVGRKKDGKKQQRQLMQLSQDSLGIHYWQLLH